MKELEDYVWFPKLLRQFQMDVIGYFVVILQLYKPIIPKLNELIQHKDEVIIDLCSGSALPAIFVQEKCKPIKKTIFTDLFPPKYFNNLNHLMYQATPLNVLQFTPSTTAIYTMYNAFHHFNKNEQQRIIETFKHQKSRFLIAEILQPTFLSFLQVSSAATIGQLLICPFLRPFSFQRILFTYFIPINIFTVLFDGIVSVCKSATKKQFMQYLQQFSDANYTIEINTKYQFLGSVTYIIGFPKNTIV